MEATSVRLTAMWECVHMETSFTVWACLRAAEQNRYKCVMSQRCREEKGERICVYMCVCVLSAERVRGGDCSIPPAGSIDFPAQRGDVGNVSL